LGRRRQIRAGKTMRSPSYTFTITKRRKVSGHPQPQNTTLWIFSNGKRQELVRLSRDALLAMWHIQGAIDRDREQRRNNLQKGKQ
jgi:hypothetical protein